MNRIDISTKKFLNKIMYTYNKYIQMKEKYSTPYSFVFYDFNNSGYDIEMSHKGFFIWPTDKERDSNCIFCIEEISFYGYSIINNCEFMWINNEYFYIEFGDHSEQEKRELWIPTYSDLDEILEEYNTGWHFQQSTIQETIPYEQIELEVKMCYDLYNIDLKNNYIYISDLELFDLSLLEGFKIL